MVSFFDVEKLCNLSYDFVEANKILNVICLMLTIAVEFEHCFNRKRFNESKFGFGQKDKPPFCSCFGKI